MPQENVEVVHAFLEAFNRGDLDAAVSFLTDDLDLRPPSHLFDGVVFHGHAGFRAWVDRTAESWRRAEGSAREVATVGEHLVMAVHYRLIGHDSGVPVNQSYFSVWTLREGKVAAVISYPGERAALAAVGLSE
jgi:ketosteroid isomerase-like protein